ncbi:uncharacterized protein N7483_010699 [Penicillium malachiteum]|uniref:uncharacterized protein n=1 Tax=Penicillium malachiteum TaxID=1324776 RepID=UPI0025465C2E|nr:uncharacterized protein N7483_010699 [Penicillium malachiteum]KAJ5713518.1 hypothetical protein N7483_010699 [Penicillium malachiteum]
MGIAMLPEQAAMASPIESSFLLPAKVYCPPGPPSNEGLFLLPAKTYSPPSPPPKDDSLLLSAKVFSRPVSSSNDSGFLLPAKTYCPPGPPSNDSGFLLPAKTYSPSPPAKSNSPSDYGSRNSPASQEAHGRANDQSLYAVSSTLKNYCTTVPPITAYGVVASANQFDNKMDYEATNVSSNPSLVKSLNRAPLLNIHPRSASSQPLNDRNSNRPFTGRSAWADPSFISDWDFEMEQAPALDEDSDMEQAPALDKDSDISIHYPYYDGFDFWEHISLIEPVTVPRMSQIPAGFDDTSPDAMDCTDIPASISKAYPNDTIIPSLVPARLSVSIKRVPQYQAEVISPEPKRRCSQRVSVEPSSDIHTLSHTPSSLFRQRISTFLDEFYDSKHLNQANESLVSPQPPTIANRKNLFGPGGLFSNDPPIKDPEILQDAPPAGKETLLRGLGKKLKQQLTDIYPSKSSTNSPTGRFKNQIQVSLNPVDQAKLFSQLEMMICTSANNFLLRHYYEGHVSQHSINKVTNQWNSKNRPHVNQFCFDQGTQRELIMENRRTIIFTGGFVNKAVMFDSNMRNWKAIAMEMRSRTFCLPDTAIRKILYEIHEILEMLEASLSTLQELNEAHACAQLKMVKASEMKRSHTRNRLSR